VGCGKSVGIEFLAISSSASVTIERGYPYLRACRCCTEGSNKNNTACRTHWAHSRNSVRGNLCLNVSINHSSDVKFRINRFLRAGRTALLGAALQIFCTAFSTALKIFSTCPRLRQELREYHQIDNKIVTERDDAISALRYALMMLKKAKVPDYRHPFERANRQSQTQIAPGAEVSLENR
jgi:hypothetical protein